MTVHQPVTPRPSAAIAVMRAAAAGGVEVFMVRRHIRNEFAPDVFVFPGGSVRPDDRATEQDASVCSGAPEGPTALGSGFRAAALRECFEEAGVLLATRAEAPLAITPEDTERFAAYRAALQQKRVALADVARQESLRLETGALLHWAHWITPEAFPMRFTTHFFLAEMPAGQRAAADLLETTDGTWVRPEDALARFADGDFPLVFATIHQLRALRGFADIGAAYARFSGTTPRTVMPRVVRRGDEDVILLPGEPDEAQPAAPHAE